MLEIRTKYTPLPYGNLVTKILEKIRFNLDEKTNFNKKTTKIGKVILPSMHYELKNGKIIGKPITNKINRKHSSQNIPIEIIKSDDSSPQILTTRDLMKILCGKIDLLNEKTNFI